MIGPAPSAGDARTNPSGGGLPIDPEALTAGPSEQGPLPRPMHDCKRLEACEGMHIPAWVCDGGLFRHWWAKPAGLRLRRAPSVQALCARSCAGQPRKGLRLMGCVQPTMMPNIDAWWPMIDGLTSAGKVEVIVMNASGCGVTVTDDGHALAHDSACSDKARRVGALTRDLSGLQRGGVEQHLGALGFEVQLAGSDSHLCCGWAGTCSVLQTVLATPLRDRQLEGAGPLADAGQRRSFVRPLATGARVKCLWRSPVDQETGAGAPPAGRRRSRRRCRRAAAARA